MEQTTSSKNEVYEDLFYETNTWEMPAPSIVTKEEKQFAIETNLVIKKWLDQTINTARTHIKYYTDK